MPGLCSPKTPQKIETEQIKHKIPILKRVFQGISRLANSSYSVWWLQCQQKQLPQSF